MTPLKRHLIQRIQAHGPINVADFMAECLFNPNHGYYTTKQPFGRSGDFITAPAISQMFGELTAAWLIEYWRSMGQPSPFTLCEIGPGDATWMQDIARTIKKAAPDFLAAAHIVLIEQSDRLADLQMEALTDAPANMVWAKNIDDLPPQATVFIANELFDAIPTRQFVKTPDEWVERVLAVENDELIFAAGTASIDPNLLPLNAAGAADETIFEYAPAREALVANIAHHIKTNGGAGLLIDYGHEKSGFGDTLQAVRNHAYDSLFAHPGEADMTSHVDFEALTIAATGAGAAVQRIITQGEFLLAMGLIERAGQLGAGKDGDAQQTISDAVHRLAGNDKGQMGDLFKVMCIMAPDMPPPPGFNTRENEESTLDKQSKNLKI